MTLKKKKWKWKKSTATWNRFVLQLFVELEVGRVRHSSSFVDDEVCCSRSHLDAAAEENHVEKESIDDQLLKVRREEEDATVLLSRHFVFPIHQRHFVAVAVPDFAWKAKERRRHR